MCDIEVGDELTRGDIPICDHILVGEGIATKKRKRKGSTSGDTYKRQKRK